MTTPRAADPGFTLTTPLEEVGGIDARHASAMRKLGIRSVAHLVNHLPFRHEFEAAETTIEGLGEDEIGTTRGEVTSTRVSGYGRARRFEAVVCDEAGGRLEVTWFNQPYLSRRVLPGMLVRVQGKVRRKGAALQMANPSWSAIDPERDEPEARESRLRPVYPATEDAPSRVIEEAVDRVLEGALGLIEEHLPEGVRRERALPTLREAYRMMHRPRDEAEVLEARRRLVYDELLLMQLGVHMKRAQIRATLSAPALRWSERIDRHIRERLPFTLTPGQDRVVRELVEDLRRESPANRLIQGDVGSGKTAVALYGMLMAVASRRQAALMAPTELLAEQHMANIAGMLRGSDVRVALLTGSMGEDDRARVREGLASGEVDLVIGTHALLSEGVRMKSLGVVVIDEQHRFGVHQRAVLRERAGESRSSPHVLVMTATPIPRTLSLTVFGDLDVSTIEGLPPGRKEVETRLVGPGEREAVYGFVRERVAKGGRAFVVAPTIDEASGSERSVSSLRRELESGLLAGVRIGAVHGRLKPLTRDRVMERFRTGGLDVLVATTVIEVGVDIPDATLMVVEHAERFGIAQLHQLRGRIGRGSKGGVCVLIGDPANEEGQERLRAVASTTDGFALAERDLEIRGPGEVIGSRQSGAAPFRVASFPEDTELLMLARRDAAEWIERSPSLSGEGEGVLRRRLMKAHGASMGLSDIA